MSAVTLPEAVNECNGLIIFAMSAPALSLGYVQVEASAPGTGGAGIVGRSFLRRERMPCRDGGGEARAARKLRRCRAWGGDNVGAILQGSSRVSRHVAQACADALVDAITDFAGDGESFFWG